jgi:hypothetical protein
LSQPLPHLCFNLFVISETFATQLQTALRNKLPTGNISLSIIFALSPFAHKRNSKTELHSSVLRSSSTDAIYTTETILWTSASAT